MLCLVTPAASNPKNVCPSIFSLMLDKSSACRVNGESSSLEDVLHVPLPWMSSERIGLYDQSDVDPPPQNPISHSPNP